MSQLYDLIESGEIGLVAAQDVDRFFRDMTQIETNIFIDACRRNNVQVLTPTFSTTSLTRRRDATTCRCSATTRSAPPISSSIT